MKLLIALIPVALISAGASFVFWTIEEDSKEFDPFVVRSLESCRVATEALGTGIQVVDHSGMEWETMAGAGAASGTFRVEGSQGAADAHATLEQHASRWSVTGIRLMQGARAIDLAECL